MTKGGISIRWLLSMRARFAFVFFCLVLVFTLGIHAQEFITPSAYLDEASGVFGAVEDYQADITITEKSGEEESEPMVGTLFYKTPNKLRIDFVSPREQVLAVEGDLLTVYVPRYDYILEQKLQRRSDNAVALMASEKELSYLKSNYSVAYLVGPDPVPLDDDLSETVIKLKFQSLSSAEGFAQLEIAFDDEQMIRRVTGFNGARTLVMDYENISTNQNIPDARFDYEAPANANVFRNFLFEVIE